METVTFRRDNVLEHINNNFIPLKYHSGPDAEQFRRFDIQVTPTFVILDSEGNEVGRIKGYHAPDEFISRLEGLGES